MLMDGLAEVLSEKEYWSVSEIIEKVNRCGISNNDWFASVFGVKARSNSWLYGAPIPKE